MSDTPRTCDHFYAEHTSRYDLRCTRCGASSIDSERGDWLMLGAWSEWARQTGNPGAAALFARAQYRLKHAKPVPASSVALPGGGEPAP